MGLAELSSMVRRGEMSHREANELDGVNDERMYCSNCQKLFDEDELTKCGLCSCDICGDCLIGGAYCSNECLMEDCKDDS